ncbi:hypothetical protein JB92DRAFT_3100460 [Gautieria morchelliformis]|nr:hypothetical protein JB92DRAFT_3100460 [Gautieria morchelliformis]
MIQMNNPDQNANRHLGLEAAVTADRTSMSTMSRAAYREKHRATGRETVRMHNSDSNHFHACVFAVFSEVFSSAFFVTAFQKMPEKCDLERCERSLYGASATHVFLVHFPKTPQKRRGNIDENATKMQAVTSRASDYIAGSAFKQVGTSQGRSSTSVTDLAGQQAGLVSSAQAGPEEELGALQYRRVWLLMVGYAECQPITAPKETWNPGHYGVGRRDVCPNQVVRLTSHFIFDAS